MSVAWLEVDVRSPLETAAEVQWHLEKVGHKGWVVLQEEPETVYRLYVALEENWAESLFRLEQELREFGSQVSRGETVRDEDWAENWKRFYHPLTVGQRFVICPSWESFDAKDGRLVVTLDPGSAFGTGYHASTRLCLDLLAKHARPGHSEPFLDLGTGSGILGIAAGLMGLRDIRAVDNDPVAVRVARENFAINGVGAEIELAEGPPPGPYAMVAANLVADLHVELAQTLWDSLRPGGGLIAGGIIDVRRHLVEEAFARVGFSAMEAAIEGEWTALLVQR